MSEKSEYRAINIGDFYEGQYRQNAALAVIAWLDAKEYSFDALDALVQGVSGTADEEAGPEQQRVYEETFNSVADFLIMCGADSEAVQELFETGDADRAQRMAKFIIENPAFVEKTDFDLMNTFIVGNSSNDAIEEGLVKKVVDVKVKWVRKKLKKVRMSSAQKAGLKKARRKA
ncbi:MAG: hypothetical protein ABIK68_08645, partial [bacterium]